MRTRILVIAVLVILASVPAFAQATAEARGKVVDADGKPVVGAEVTFTNAKPPNAVYKEKTDKKGFYYFPNLLHVPADKYGNGLWKVQIQAEGYNTAKIKWVSRTADRTMIDQSEGKLRGGAVAEIRISGLGEATVDFVLSNEEVKPAAAAAAAAAAPKPEEQDPWTLAKSRFATKDYEGSLPFFQKALEATPDDTEKRELYAYALLRLDRYGEAEAQALKAEQIAPGTPGPNLILAEVYKAKGDNDKAWEALMKEKALAPENVGVLERISSLGPEMGKLDEAIAAAETLTRVNPSNAEAWVTLGGLYADKGLTEKSELAFRKVVELDPNNAAQTFFNIGVVIGNKSVLSDADNRKAVEAFKKAVEIKPDYTAAHRELAFALLRSNDREGARTEIEKYLELSPNAPDAAELRGIAKSLGKKK